MADALRSIALPPPAAEPTAQPVAACSDSLSFKRLAPQRSRKDRSTQILAASLIGGAARKPQSYCRDRPGTAQIGVYRPVETVNSYLAAISDAGRAILIEPSFELGGEREGYTFSALELGRTIVYLPLSALPAPEEALAYVMREKPVAITEFADGKVTTTVNSDVMK